jgi:cellulose synthase/poly-beta-1,6-N-acetylglucosamine synthase-like glycosyltransferase
VVLIPCAERQGKTACLNRAVPAAKGEIVVFTDANAMFAHDLLEKIAGNFSDAQVGLVTGWTKYRNVSGEEESVGLYGRMEKITKEAESLVSSCVGADGAIFAVRKPLYRPLQDHDINDFVIPLHVIGEGKRAVLDPEIYCHETPSNGEGKEFRRQVRITNRTLGAIWRNVRFLNPFQYGWFAFFLLSHKLIRLLVPFFFAGTFVIAFWLSSQSAFFAGYAFAQTLFVGLGAAALRFRGAGRAGQLCSFFLLTISAQLVGWGDWATGKSAVMWTPQR